jgi:hypothetical protein
MAAVEIVPIAQDHVESFHRALDFVARERRCLSFREAPPLEALRAFVLGRGVGRPGRRLVRCRVELSVRENNASAIALYNRVGFEIEGLQRNATRVDGAYENMVLMAILFWRQRASRQLVISLAEPIQAEREANSLFGRLKNNKSRGFG